MGAALEMTDVTKRFGATRAPHGTLFAGAAGREAGTARTERRRQDDCDLAAAWTQEPTSGDVHVMGGNPSDPATRTRVGAMLQETMLPPGIRVRELIDFSRSLCPRPMPLNETVQRSGLEDLLPMRVERLSGGQRRRVLFAMAISGNPELLFLDEPTAGIDAETRQTFWRGLEATLAQTHGTLLFTSHYLEEAERYATRVVVIRHGRVVAEGTPRELRNAANARTIHFTLPEPRPAEQIKEIAGATSAELYDGTYMVLAADPDEAVRRLIHAGLPISQLEVGSGSLEEALANMSEEREQFRATGLKACAKGWST